MQHLKPPTIGADAETTAMTRFENSTKPSIEPRLISAGRQVARLFKMVSLPDVGDPKAFISAATALFAGHAVEVADAAIPELATRSDRPTLRLMREVLDDLTDRAIERQRKADSRHALPPPDRKRTPEEQARAEQQANELRRAFGLPEQRDQLSKAG